MLRLTADLLRTATGCTADAAALYAPHLDAACAYYGIGASVDRLAMFLAQVAHESGSLRYVRELADGSAYEGRRDLGNTEPGDGKRYRGRGLIQITGRANYRATTQRLRARLARTVPDFEATPQALELPEWAAWSAADFWDSRGLNGYADRGDFVGITRRINGGTNGLADRQERLALARRVLALATDDAAQDDATPREPAPIVDRSIRADDPGDATPTAAPEWAPPTPPDGGPRMAAPLIPILTAVLPSIVQAIPKLGQLFGSGSEVAQRNVKAAELVVNTVTQATGAVNAQDAAERVATDPAAAQAAARAVEGIWYQLTEVGSGGIAQARQDDTRAALSGLRAWHSPSFWALLLLLPVVYMLVGSVAGLWGYTAWSDDVRAAIATAVVSLIVGGASGYYWGSTTTRNKVGDRQ